jgi:uncharacterized membrane protein
MKRYKWSLILSTAALLLPVVVGLVLWSRLPDSVATHFDFNNVPNGWSPKWVVVFGIPAFLLVIHLLSLWATLRVDGEKKGLPIGLLCWIVPAITFMTEGMVYAYALEVAVDIGLVACLLIGVLFVALGNYLPKCQVNSVCGVRVPWTMKDPDIWARTHRVAGISMVSCGVAILVGAWFESLRVVLFGLFFVAVLVPLVYSYVIYKKKK